MRPPPALLRYDRTFPDRWGTRARAAWPGSARVAAAVRAYEHALDRFLALRAGVFHGELYPSNVIVQDTSEGLRVCPVDWEMAAVGPVAVDVAALTGGWPEPERRALIAAYAEEAGEELEPFLTAVDLAELHLCVRWLGWAEGWTPPVEHATDWLGRALELVERLGL
jgi:aminoglycoside phosphotransferase (APT) family kinase protein